MHDTDIIRQYGSRVAAIQALADGTRTSADLAAVTGISSRQVRATCQWLGIKLPPIPRPSPWTAEMIAELPGLLAKGYSCREIAAHFRGVVTRNAVISKCSRLGLRGTARAEHVRRTRSRQQAPRQRPAMPSNAQQSMLTAPAIPRPDQRVTVAEIEGRQCRYIFGDVGDHSWTFCARPTPEGSPWCADHHSIVHERILI